MVCCVRCNSESKNNSLCEECEGILQNRINIVLEEEFPQTEGYDSKYFVDFLKYFECPLCLGGLRDPVQIAGECGHVFCESCLNRATPGDPKTCPLDREPFIQTFPDRSKRREVLSLRVICQNNGCSWTGELSDLLDHLRGNCGRLLLSCLNSDCPEKLCREKIIEHCLECKFAPGIPCTFVQFGCQFEGTRSTIDHHMKCDVNEHLLLASTKITQQENKINQQESKINQQENKINQQENKINQQENKINQQDNKIKQQENKINQQENKINQQENKINQQENKINQQENKINQQNNKINEQDNKIIQQESKINQQENRIKEQENKFKELNDKVQQIFDINKTKDIKLNELETKINVLQENNNDLKIQNAEIVKNNQDLKKQHEELQKVNTKLKINHEKLQGKFDILQSDFDNKDDIFSWKISNYQTKFQNAQNKNPEELYSPELYTSHGYKFKLSAWLNGHSSSESTHTSVFFHLCKGVNDDTLEWPFNKKYTLTIVSQNDRLVDKTCTVPAEQVEKAKQYFIKPTTDRNGGWGWKSFLPHTEKKHYIKDDTMVIKCVVDC